MAEDTVSSGGFEAALQTAASAGTDTPAVQPSASPETPAAGATDPSGATPAVDPAVAKSDPTPGRFQQRISELVAQRKAVEERASKLAWAEQYQPDQIQRLTQLTTWMDRDPVAFLQWFQSQVQAHPVYGKALSPAAHEPPAPDLVTADGTRVYSADQLQKWHQWNERQLESKLAQRIAPLEQAREQAEEAQARTQLHEQVRGAARKVLQGASEWPGFTEHTGAIKAAMLEHPDWSVHDAYIRVVVPQLTRGTETKVIASLQQKAAASTLNPSSVPTTTPTSPKTAAEALEQAFAAAGGRR